MMIITKENYNELLPVINEFIVAVKVDTRAQLPVELLKYLRSRDIKIGDGTLFDEICTTLEKKLFLL